jgi:glycerol-3-phosphate dehydrogenase
MVYNNNEISVYKGGMVMYDIVIIGAGVVGSSIARVLSKYDLKIAVMDKEADICEQTSKANSGIVHSGYDAHVGSMKAKMNLRGSKMMESLCKDLDIPYRRNGSLVLAFSKTDLPKLEALKDQGDANGVEGLQILSTEEVLLMEPNLSNEVTNALYAPTGGIVDPFKLTIAQAEVACQNGVEFKLKTKVIDVEKHDDYFIIFTDKGEFKTRILVNAAGVYADDVNNQLSAYKLKITPRKGEYCLFDKQVGNIVDKTIFQLPTALGKGVLVTPTPDGNLLVGPTANDIIDKDDISTTAEGLKSVIDRARKSVKQIPMGFVITAFAGLRATEQNGDFVIGEAIDVPNFFNAAGIESPGLTSAPAIGEYLGAMIANRLNAIEKSDYIKTRTDTVRFESLSLADKADLIKENPEYGKIICRCELVTLAQIKDAIHRPLGAKTIDGIKRRTRAGAGRCQGGFCSPRVIEILAKELHLDPREVAKSDSNSVMLIEFDKDSL